MLKAVIFDFDGVIYNSPKFYLKTRDIFLRRYNIKQTKQEHKMQLALPTKEFVEYINKNYNLNISFEYYFKEKYKIFNEISKNKLKLNPGVKTLLKNFKKNNIKTAISSSNEKEVLTKKLKNFKILEYFDAIVSSEDVKRHKPYPDPFLKAAKKLKVNPKDCVGIEDAPTGVKSINSANMKSVGLITEFTIKKDFKLEHANLIIKNITELNIKKLKNLF